MMEEKDMLNADEVDDSEGLSFDEFIGSVDAEMYGLLGDEEFEYIDDDDDDDDFEDFEGYSCIKVFCEENLKEEITESFLKELRELYKQRIADFIESYSGSFIKLPGMYWEKIYDEFCDDDDVTENDKKNDVYYSSDINIDKFCSRITNTEDGIEFGFDGDLCAYTNDCQADNFDAILNPAIKAVQKKHPDISYQIEVNYSWNDSMSGDTTHYIIKSKNCK